MTLTDLGTLTGPIALFGGAVSNSDALRAFLTATAGTTRICTGDIVAYCADPAGSVDLVRASNASVVRGNCEISLATGSDGCGCGFVPGSTCDRLSAAWYQHASERIGADDRRWMAGLPDFAVFTAHGRRWGVLHGGVSDVSRFLWPTDPDSAFEEEMSRLIALVGPVDGIVAGHCGLPFIREISGVVWANAGALGMPANDGDPRTSYAILDETGPTLRRLSYDHQAAAAAMRQMGLTQGYDRCLETGFWPSEEVLPVALRRAA